MAALCPSVCRHSFKAPCFSTLISSRNVQPRPPRQPRVRLFFLLDKREKYERGKWKERMVGKERIRKGGKDGNLMEDVLQCKRRCSQGSARLLRGHEGLWIAALNIYAMSSLVYVMNHLWLQRPKRLVFSVVLQKNICFLKQQLLRYFRKRQTNKQKSITEIIKRCFSV